MQVFLNTAVPDQKFSYKIFVYEKIHFIWFILFFLGPTTAGPTASSLTTESTIPVMYPIDFVSI
jgi:hypothetical protein